MSFEEEKTTGFKKGNPKPLTFAQVAARADRKVKAFAKQLEHANPRHIKSIELEAEFCFWRGVAPSRPAH